MPEYETSLTKDSLLEMLLRPEPVELTEIELPENFRLWCWEHQIKASRLLSALAYSFALDPPRELILIRDEAAEPALH